MTEVSGPMVRKDKGPVKLISPGCLRTDSVVRPG